MSWDFLDALSTDQLFKLLAQDETRHAVTECLLAKGAPMHDILKGNPRPLQARRIQAMFNMRMLAGKMSFALSKRRHIRRLAVFLCCQQQMGITLVVALGRYRCRNSYVMRLVRDIKEQAQKGAIPAQIESPLRIGNILGLIEMSSNLVSFKMLLDEGILDHLS